MNTLPKKDIYHFVEAIKLIGLKDDRKKKNIDRIRENLRQGRKACTELMEQSYTEAFTGKEEKDNKND